LRQDGKQKILERETVRQKSDKERQDIKKERLEREQ
jgi:hypothetical protein